MSQSPQLSRSASCGQEDVLEITSGLLPVVVQGPSLKGFTVLECPKNGLMLSAGPSDMFPEGISVTFDANQAAIEQVTDKTLFSVYQRGVDSELIQIRNLHMLGNAVFRYAACEKVGFHIVVEIVDEK